MNQATDVAGSEGIRPALVFIKRFRWPIVFALGIRLAIGALANYQPDFSIWLHVIRSFENGLPLYRDGGGFSYPPLFAYWLQLLGVVGKAGAPHFYVVSHSAVNLAPFDLLGTVFGNLVVKLPLMFSDMLTGYFIYRIVFLVSADFEKSKTALFLWIFNPLVIFVSSVNAQIDCLEVAFLMAAFLSVLKSEYVLAGLLLALSIDTKLMTIFLVPIFFAHIFRKESLKSALSFMMSLSIWIFIVALPYLSVSCFNAIFQRDLVSSSVSFGGLGFYGLLNLPALGVASSFVYTHSMIFNSISTLIEVISSGLIAILIIKSKKSHDFGIELGLVCIVILLVNILCNPQYLELLIPFLCIVRGRWIASRLQLKLPHTFITYSGLFFYFGLVSLSGFFYTTSSFFGLPSAAQINSEFYFMNAFSHGPGFLPNTNGHTIFFICTLFTVTSLIYIFVFLLRVSTDDC